MQRHSKQRQYEPFDLSIAGDEIEQHRKQLEHTLQHADLSFHLSSTPDSASDHESLEHARHAPEPVAFRDFASFEQQSREYLEEGHPWSYRTVDDEDGINPYGGETMSTAAHHASNLTLAAGLGGRGNRHDISLSGAEYDPDRPLRDIFPAVASQISAFRDEPSRSRYPGMGSVDAMPYVVDNTAELDRFLQSGHAPTPSRSVRIRSPRPPPSEASSDAESVGNKSRLSEALSKVSLSPRRPRNTKGPISRTQSTDSNYKHSPMREQERSRVSSRHFPPSMKSMQQSPARMPSASRRPDQSMDDGMTPKAKRTGIFPSMHQQDLLAGGYQQTPKVSGRKASQAGRAGVSARTPSINIVNASPARPSPRKSRESLNTSRGGIHLPDVTGITNAVESPARPQMSYYKYNAEGKPREVDVYFITALNEVQTKLYRLEEENSISRRRVRELEMELELCKREVARERTRVLEREDLLVQQQMTAQRLTKDSKGKGRERDDLEAMESKYKEAVEEKKALEALISTLRSHLTRLTSELADHKQLLTELRESREADSRAMRDKSEEIARLRQEVERLGGEVEVLRGVVEEGLKHRRGNGRSRVLDGDGRTIQDDDEDLGAVSEELVELQEPQPAPRANEPANESSEESDEASVADPRDLSSLLGSSRGHEKTMRTDHATLGSSQIVASSSTPFVNNEDLRQISAELEERRSERSRAATSPDVSRSHVDTQRSFVSERRSQAYDSDNSPPVSPSPVGGRSQSLLQNDADDEEESDVELPPSPARERDHDLDKRQSTPMPNSRTRATSVRPAAPTPAHALRQPTAGPSVEETPFPKIRGEHLERLFFSAPEHNPKTCTMCTRQARNRHNNLYVPDEPPSSSLGPIHPRYREQRRVIEHDPDEDEGFAEEDEDDLRQRLGKGQDHRQGGKRRLPPQTTLSQVIRELEDDFTHYKSIYVELADQYKDMDPISNVRKRNMLAQHLREVVDVIEQKGDQIAKLYSLLTFRDTPSNGSSEKLGKRVASARGVEVAAA
ncbi:hypothetical protein ONZ45_g4789 [Pleurotus djamor]|nr:hypothetical protein ONZ45_g4789 [Pleurotus djamor]